MPRLHRFQRKYTSRGAATRARIVAIAAQLIERVGIGEASLDDVMELSGASKSQLYHYFENKEELLREASRVQVARVLGAQQEHLAGFDSMAGMVRWARAVMDLSLRQGCPLGALVYQLPVGTRRTGEVVESGLQAWRQLIEAGLAKMQERGELAASAVPSELALGVLGALQGGLLLSRSAKSNRPLEIAFDMALRHVRAFAPAPPSAKRVNRSVR